MNIREEQCNKVCRILDDVLANRTTERDSLIVAVRKAFESLEQFGNSEPLPSAQPDENKYEYHYDHTDCIWYRSEARNRCPATCAQYRDGRNDAMNYIFRDGEGYRLFRRDKKHEG